MKITLKQTLVAVALAGAFTSAQAGVTFLTSGTNLGSNPSGGDFYTVSHTRGSFADIFTFSIIGAATNTATAVTLDNSGAAPALNIDNGVLSLFQDLGTVGVSVGDVQIGSSVLFGAGPANASASIDSLLSNGSYYYKVAGNAVGRFGGKYDFNADAVPEPETYALMLVGLGLIGFIGRRRLNKSASALNFA